MMSTLTEDWYRYINLCIDFVLVDPYRLDWVLVIIDELFTISKEMNMLFKTNLFCQIIFIQNGIKYLQQFNTHM